MCGKEIFRGSFRSFWEKIGKIDRDWDFVRFWDEPMSILLRKWSFFFFQLPLSLGFR